MSDNNQSNESIYDGHAQYTTAYIKILSTYQKQIDDSIKRKNELKNKFFNLIKGIIITLIILFIVSIFVFFILMMLMVRSNY